MSLLSKLIKKIILWMLGDGKIEFLLEIAKRPVAKLESRDDLSSDEKQMTAQSEIKDKAKELGKEFTKHLINLSIELALLEHRENIYD